MKEVVGMLDMWLWEAFLHSYITNNLLLVPKRPLKGDVHMTRAFSLCKSEIKMNCLMLLCKRGKIRVIDP
jgi:hypothetical protein